MLTPILATKLFMPPLRAASVPRPGLVARLSQGLAAGLTIVSAPAGFGKTTLISAWATGQSRVAWLSLDESDSDPHRFLTYLIAALRTLEPELGASLLRALSLLGVPILVTEQYPRGLGHTATEVAAELPPGCVSEKLTMSCWGASSFRDRLTATGRTQVLVAGIEAHACVNQTVHDLIAAGYQVHVARDATSSRRAEDVVPAWEKMRAAGMVPTASEQALLDIRLGDPAHAVAHLLGNQLGGIGVDHVSRLHQLA